MARAVHSTISFLHPAVTGTDRPRSTPASLAQRHPAAAAPMYPSRPFARPGLVARFASELLRGGSRVKLKPMSDELVTETMRYLTLQSFDLWARELDYLPSL